jgi:asparagine synthase (glutamine-hydrolysing)
VLARDRTGIRPLFYTVHDGRLVFASEIKALFAARGVPRRLLPAALGQVFTFWSTQAPTTMFEDVMSLPPGHLLVLEHGSTQVRKYWDWVFPQGDPVAQPIVLERRPRFLDRDCTGQARYGHSVTHLLHHF